ncbi:WhiB family transcriptional regulator [Amycolatopsis sp. NPDC004079]|uniref:WhiB family transcriptional regulator n=1 Tax=Amycolatopsis sp. NPDC004079 TaxID=3154549 RepID=UPI0033BEB413
MPATPDTARRREHEGDLLASEPQEEQSVDEVLAAVAREWPSFGQPEEWRKRSLCSQTDPDSFFPDKGGSTRPAKRICLGCQVKDDCLEYALVHDERFGIWGGLSERERRKLKKRLAEQSDGDSEVP